MWASINGCVIQEPELENELLNVAPETSNDCRRAFDDMQQDINEA